MLESCHTEWAEVGRILDQVDRIDQVDCIGQVDCIVDYVLDRIVDFLLEISLAKGFEQKSAVFRRQSSFTLPIHKFQGLITWL